MQSIYLVKNRVLSQICSSTAISDVVFEELRPDMVLESVLTHLEMSKRITILVHDQEVDLIESIVEALTFNSPRVDPLVRLVVVSTLKTWSGTLFESNANRSCELFHQRVQCQEQFENSSVENALLAMKECGKARVNIAYLSKLFGGTGYDYHGIFQSAWTSNVPNVPSSSTGMVVPSAHIDHTATLLKTLLTGDDDSFLNFLFDVHSVTLDKFMVDFVEKAETSMIEEQSSDIYKTLLDDVVNIGWMSKLQDIHTTNKHPILQSFELVWNEFVVSNGLAPVHLAVTGPPKSGKTALAKHVASLMDIPHVDVTSSVSFVFNYADPFPGDLDVLVMESSRTKIISAMEQKFSEGLAGKKGKDKVPLEQKLDFSGITDTFCASLPNDILADCVAFRSYVDPMCRKKGYVLDCWEKDLFPGGNVQSFQQYKPADSTRPCRLVIQNKVDRQKIIDKQIETLGAQAAKSKEGQALIKSLEATLDAYFQSLTLDSGGRAVDPTVRAWLDQGMVEYLEVNDGSLDNIEIAKKVLLPLIKQIYGFVPGWISGVELETIDHTEPFISDSEGTLPETAICSSDRSPALAQSDNCVQKYNDYLAATVMGTLAKGMVSVVRERPKDPIKELARILYETSSINQKETMESAKAAFDQLLQTS